jgi:hypothetical protein
MNLSYVRIRLPLENAIQEFAAWLQWPVPEDRMRVDGAQAIDLACDSNGHWRGPAVFVHHKNEWTIFEDLTGFLGAKSSAEWLRFAGTHELVFASANDAIEYAAFIAIVGGEVVQDFFFDVSVPLLSRNSGGGLIEAASWTRIADFVDEDDLAATDTGWLWQLIQSGR